MPPKRLAIAFCAVALTATLNAPDVLAKITPHPMFSDGAVLQRGKPVPVWGTASDGETITVKIQGQEATAVAKGGQWTVNLKPLTAGGPFTLTITGDADDDKANPVEVKDEIDGDVCVCSGQSNLEWQLSRTVSATEAIAASADPMLRLFTVPKKVAHTEQTDFTSKDFPLKPGREVWKAAAPATVPGFSAVGYYFGRDLRKELKVPVGLINTSYGGTPAEAWTHRQALESEESLKSLFKDDARAMAVYPMLMERHKAALERYKTAVAEAKDKGNRPPTAPRAPSGPNTPNRPSVLYNGMIAPIVPYSIAGAIWYQGESNAGRASQYHALFSTMIESWRDAWKQGEFPFLFVQLAPFMRIVTEPGDSDWAALRESQLKTSQTVSRTAMAVITAVGEVNDIHPQRKGPVGARLALAARAIAYGEPIEFSGPEYAGMKMDGSSIVLQFKHTGGGLEAREGALKGFAIAGEDHKFVNAEATIEGDTIVVKSPDVSHPVAVRYGWANFPLGNLWNKAGLPASPFRTDDFSLNSRNPAAPRVAAPRAAATR